MLPFHSGPTVRSWIEGICEMEEYGVCFVFLGLRDGVDMFLFRVQDWDQICAKLFLIP